MAFSDFKIAEIPAPNIYEADFSDDEGQTYAMQSLGADLSALLHYHLLNAA